MKSPQDALTAILTSKRGRAFSISKTVKDKEIDVVEPYLFIVEPMSDYCVTLFNEFYQTRNVKVLNGSFVELEEPYDCLIIPGNAFGLVESNRTFQDLKM